MIADRLRQIEDRIAAAAERSQRSPSAIQVVAVSKHQSVESMRNYAEILCARSQIALFGESYVQEYVSKRSALNINHTVHLIGPLQSNKVARAVELFDLIESVHSLRVAKLISQQAQKHDKQQAIYLQVNVSNDHGKHGFDSTEIIELLRNEIESLPNIEIRGLMTITRLYSNAEDARTDFRALRQLRDKLQSEFSFSGQLALSMGMSADYEVAVEEGATHVRIGSALFGERS